VENVAIQRFFFILCVACQRIQSKNMYYCVSIACIFLLSYIQNVPGGKDLTSGECSLGQTIAI
jgi:hypothetical protein